MRDEVFVKQKTIPIEVNFLLGEKFHFEFNKFFCKFSSKKLMIGGLQGVHRKEPLFVRLKT